MLRNRFILGSLGAAVILICAGCSHNVAPAPNVPVNNSSQPASQANDHCAHPDNFDTAGQDIADGSRFVWNEAHKAWEWVTSDENKKRLNDLIGAVRAAYAAAQEYYEKHKNDTAPPDNNANGNQVKDADTHPTDNNNK